MGKVKTISDYESQIKILYSQIQEQKAKIEKCNNLKAPKKDIALVKKKLLEELVDLESQMWTQRSSWAHLAKLIIFQSPEEHYPWTSEELGYEVRKMLTKKEISIEQTADYQAYYEGNGYAGWIPFIVERKGGKEKTKPNPNDLYSTLSNEKSRQTFYKEILRFKEDSRFTEMYLIAECSYEDFIKYIPAFNGTDGHGHAKRNVNHIGVSVGTREATIAGLEMRGCHVIFSGSRPRAIKMYRDLLRQWLLKNYDTVLGLNKIPYDDVEFLKTKKARLEAELAYVNDALKVVA